MCILSKSCAMLANRFFVLKLRLHFQDYYINKLIRFFLTGFFMVSKISLHPNFFPPRCHLLARKYGSRQKSEFGSNTLLEIECSIVNCYVFQSNSFLFIGNYLRCCVRTFGVLINRWHNSHVSLLIHSY